MRRFVLSFSFLLLPALVSAPALAGVVVQVKSYKGADRKGDSQTGRMLIDGNKIRIDGTKDSEQGGAMVFRGDKKELVNIAPSQKKAMVIDVASLAAFGDFQKQLETQMEAMVSQAPKEQQAQMRKAMEAQKAKLNAPPAKRKVVKTKETRTISGVKCVKYDLFKGDKKVRELYVAPTNKVSGGPEVLAGMRKMASFLDEVSRKMPGGGRGDAPFEAMLDIDGIPMLTRHLRDGTTIGEEEIVSTKVQNIKASEFDVPAGYTRETLADAIKGRHAGGPGGAPHGGAGN